MKPYSDERKGFDAARMELDADDRSDFGRRRSRTRLYWAADDGSVAGSVVASLSFAGFGVLTSGPGSED